MCECTPEIWAPIADLQGWYEVSTCGGVRSVDRVIHQRNGATRHFPGHVLSPLVDPDDGHLTVALWQSGTSRRRPVHKLVLETFVGSCPPGMEGCHNDGAPAHNCVANLRWGTRSGNAYDRVLHGTDRNARKLTCPLEHLLALPNLPLSKLPHRECLACKRARADRQRAWARGQLIDFRVAADWHYARIMCAA